MGRTAAAQGDQVTGTDVHVILVPSPAGPVPTPTALPFTGTITTDCCPTVLIAGKPAATLGSGATNLPPHIPPNGSFQTPPSNTGVIVEGSPTVLIEGKPAARHGDRVTTCNDPAPAPNAQVIASALLVQIG